jgi:hypothetical protein
MNWQSQRRRARCLVTARKRPRAAAAERRTVRARRPRAAPSCRRSRNDALAVGQERAADVMGVPLERFLQRARRDVPEQRRLVPARRHAALAVGRESAPRDLARAPLNFAGVHPRSVAKSQRGAKILADIDAPAGVAARFRLPKSELSGKPRAVKHCPAQPSIEAAHDGTSCRRRIQRIHAAESPSRRIARASEAPRKARPSKPSNVGRRRRGRGALRGEIRFREITTHHVNTIPPSVDAHQASQPAAAQASKAPSEPRSRCGRASKRHDGA